MSQEQEQSRLSLRLRRPVDQPPEAPLQPPDPAPVADTPKPPETVADTGSPKTSVSSPATGEAPKAPRPRLSAIIRPDQGAPAAAEPPSPVPEAPSATPVEQASPAPPAPGPEPLATVQTASPVETAQAPAQPAPIATAANPDRPAVKPPPPPQAFEEPDAKSDPKPPSAKTVGIVAIGGLALVLAGIAYLFFVDPFGLFDEPTPVAATAPATTASPAQPVPAAPPTAPSPAEAVAAPPAIPADTTPEFEMPPPAPLLGGEEIAPGVVRLPRDSAPVSFPEAQPREPVQPKPNPAYTALVNNLNVTGIRANSSGGYLMIGGSLYRPGDIVDAQSRLEFVGIDSGTISFKDPAGALYTRRF